MLAEQLPPTGIALLSAVDRRCARRCSSRALSRRRAANAPTRTYASSTGSRRRRAAPRDWDGDWQQRGLARAAAARRPAYRSLDARDATHPDALSLQGDLEAMGLTPVRGDEGQPRSLKLHPGCRARITAVDANMIKQLSALGRLGPLLQPGPPPRLAHDVSRYVGAEVLVVREFVAMTHLLQP